MGDRRARAIRGATTVESDTPEQIRRATRELLETIVARNGITSADVVSAIFTVTHDLTSEFPAHAARELGWLDVPLLCTLEIPVPGSLARCIRVLLHVESEVSRAGIRHVYLHDARTLRPDLAGGT
ncbi:MAG: chorismate mutase [Gemmatimonadetes bacterium]|jgi:chorismate mutase|nr:chorismate mutase [Gemmatimonadota bacterium]